MKTIFLSICIIFLAVKSFGQVQIGQDINGENFDYLGADVCMPDANTIATIADNYVGFIRTYTLKDNAWLQKGQDIPYFRGYTWINSRSLSMPDTNTLAMRGLRYNSTGDGDSSYVCIYSWKGSGWEQKGPTIQGDALDNWTGVYVNMPDSNTVAIGAPLNEANGNESGLVRIFKWNGVIWEQKGSDIYGEPQDWFGFTVFMPDSNNIAIGAPKRFGIGAVYMYKWNGVDWEQKGSAIYGDYNDDQCGFSVSMADSNNVAVGIIGANVDSVQWAGLVRIYTWNGSVWEQKGTDIKNPDYLNVGTDLSMPDTNTVGFSATYDINLQPNGSIFVSSWNGSDWEQKGNTLADETVNYIGRCVSMPDSNTVAYGSAGYVLDGSSCGLVRVFSLCSTTGIDVVNACNSYTWIDGNTYTENNNTATYVIPNAAGCDSIITLNLTINTVDVSVTNEAPTLTANATDATYKWLDCNDEMSIISGETNQSFTAIINGNYAVEITQNDCVDTSDCFTVNNLSILENSFENSLIAYPNPTKGNISIDLAESYTDIDVIVKNGLGQEIIRQTFRNQDKFQIHINEAAGIYFVEIKADDKKALLKVIKE